MTLALQPTGQQISIRRVVVHHQYPAGRNGRAVRFLFGDGADRLEQVLYHLRRYARLAGGRALSIRWRGIALGERYQSVDPVEQ